MTDKLNDNNTRSAGQNVLRLFVNFCKFGFFTFGGGWSIVAQIRELYVEREHKLTATELLDITSIARSLPGIMITNTSMIFGVRMAGLPGGVACVIGITLPPIIVLSFVTLCYTMLMSNVWVMSAMRGVRACVVPIIINALYGLLNGAFKWPPCYLVALTTFALYVFLNFSPTWLVVIGILCGLGLSEFYERRDARREKFSSSASASASASSSASDSANAKAVK